MPTHAERNITAAMRDTNGGPKIHAAYNGYSRSLPDVATQ